ALGVVAIDAPFLGEPDVTAVRPTFEAGLDDSRSVIRRGPVHDEQFGRVRKLRQDRSESLADQSSAVMGRNADRKSKHPCYPGISNAACHRAAGEMFTSVANLRQWEQRAAGGTAAMSGGPRR